MPYEEYYVPHSADTGTLITSRCLCPSYKASLTGSWPSQGIPEGFWESKPEAKEKWTPARLLAEEVLGVQDVSDIQVTLFRQLGDLG